jgi:L-rhamnose mutarotase
MATTKVVPVHHTVERVAMTLDIKPDRVQEYIKAHATPRQNIVDALRSVGLRDISLWVFRQRMFYTAAWVATNGDETFDDASTYMMRLDVTNGVF